MITLGSCPTCGHGLEESAISLHQDLVHQISSIPGLTPLVFDDGVSDPDRTGS
uniref:Uncharacterized protein n=1 Tax=uncultured prokaryote TaxID=198431 RepID=A0A0H5Q3R4_9ZZZZ|nr:hypothetical protein [uncultured prokaryote]